MEEIWKDIEWHKGSYKVSNMGRVYSIRRKKFKDTYLDKRGYVKVCLCYNYTQKIFSVHRLVAKAFIPNPNNYPQVNHKDENKQNNNVDNLEWCTNHYNEHYGTRSQRQAKSLTNGKNSKPIKQMLNGSIIKVWPSMAEAGRHGFDEGNVSACCRGKIKTAYGYQWQYA